MSAVSDWDVLVVGAGVIGSSTAYQLARAGHRTLLLDQFPLPHSRGSSTGHSRITRKAYPEAFMSKLMNIAYREWDELQRLTGDKVKITTGLVYMVEDRPQQENMIRAMTAGNNPHEVLNGRQISTRFPQFSFDERVWAAYDPEAGVLLSDKALLSIRRAFELFGGVVLENQKVDYILANDSIVTVVTQNQTYTAKRVVIATGAYTNQLLKSLGVQLPLEVRRLSVWYWKQKELRHRLGEGMPCFIHDLPGFHVYGLPSIEYPGHVKVCEHDGKPIRDAETRDLNAPDDIDIRRPVEEYIRRHLPYLEPEPSITEYCMYTLTPDRHYIIDKHPTHSNIVIAAGFSGHGFKAGLAVGLLCRDLLFENTPEIDVSPFRMSRFPGIIKSQL